jgi:hypothetical protein
MRRDKSALVISDGAAGSTTRELGTGADSLN